MAAADFYPSKLHQNEVCGGREGFFTFFQVESSAKAFFFRQKSIFGFRYEMRYLQIFFLRQMPPNYLRSMGLGLFLNDPKALTGGNTITQTNARSGKKL